MARIKRSATLDSRSARARLKVRREPYWHQLERGLALGYRRSSEGGAWVMRRYDAAARRHHERRVATADDTADADGVLVLDFAQAQRTALAAAKEEAERAVGKRYTVAEAVTDYVKHLQVHGKGADDAQARLGAYVVPRLGERLLSDLTPSVLDEWLAWALHRPRRHRQRKAPVRGKAKAREPAAMTADQKREKQRRRRSTVNRVIALFKAALNHAHSRGLASNITAWTRLKKFRAVDGARQRWLTVDEARRLVNSSSTDFRPLLRAGLLTGCRLGELCTLRARDFEPRSRTLLVAQSKSGKSRRVPLTDEGAQFFASIAAGKPEDSLLVPDPFGQSWHRMAVSREMRAACEAGKVSPIGFHGLRHSYASLLVQQGVPLILIASALGHSSTRMVEKHYGHLAPNAVAEAIRAHLPNFGSDDESAAVTDVRHRR